MSLKMSKEAYKLNFKVAVDRMVSKLEKYKLYATFAQETAIANIIANLEALKKTLED